MKSVGSFVLLLVLVVGLYALPAPQPEVCPTGGTWECSAHIESGEQIPESFADVFRELGHTSPADDVDEDGTRSANEFFEIAGGDLVSGDEWRHDLLTSTKWSFDLIEPIGDGSLIAIGYTSEESETWAPRVTRSSPARLQILDTGLENVLIDVELSEPISLLLWRDGELGVVDVDDSLTIFARP